MKATVRQTSLKYLLDRASGAVGRQSPYFLLEFYLVRLVCSAADKSISIVADMDTKEGALEIPEGGTVCVPAKKLTALVDALPDSFITLESNGDGHLIIDCGDYTGKIPGVDPVQFPAIDIPKTIPDFTCPGETIPDIISVCGHAPAEPRQNKYLLEGIHLRAENGNLTGAATNGHCLSLAGKGDLNDIELFDKGATLPPRALAELKKINTGSMDIWITDNTMVVACVGLTLSMQLLEGEYPAYRKVIPTDYISCCVVDALALAKKIERVSILSESDSILLDIQGSESGEGDIRVSAENTAGESSDLVPAEVQGENLIIRVKPEYLLRSLRSLAKDSADVLIKYGTDTQSLVILPCDHSGWNERIEIIMPRSR